MFRKTQKDINNKGNNETYIGIHVRIGNFIGLQKAGFSVVIKGYIDHAMKFME